MIDKFQRIAQAITIVRSPSIVGGLICLIYIVVTIFTSRSHEEDRLLIPSFIGLLWAISTYSFIAAFHSIPIKLDKEASFFNRVKRNINRAFHWVMGVVYLATTVAAIFVTYRMGASWLRDYGG